MFVRISDSVIINTEQVVWIDSSDEKMIVKMTDGTEHSVVNESKFATAMGTINSGATMATITK